MAILNKEDGKKLKKKKTSTQKATTNPVFNEEIVFNLKKEQLDDISINMSLYHDSYTRGELLGTVVLSSSTKGDLYVQWKEMIDGKKAIGWWHQLRTVESSPESDGGSSSGNYTRQSSTGGGASTEKKDSLKKKSKSPTINFANFKMKSLSLLSNSPVN